MPINHDPGDEHVAKERRHSTCLECGRTIMRAAGEDRFCSHAHRTAWWASRVDLATVREGNY